MFPTHPGCPIILETEHHYLALCTMVRGNNLLPKITEWVVYHSLLGIERFYIYVNDPFDAYAQFALPNVTFVPFQQAELQPWFFQQSMQNDCVQRARGKVDWVGLNDIDERFQFFGRNNQTLLEYLTGQGANNVGAIQALNQFWGSYGNNTNATTDLIMDKYCWRHPNVLRSGREKILLQPTKIQYISVHMITLGGPVVRADLNDLRNAHFKATEKGGIYELGPQHERVYDESLRRGFVNDITRWIKENT
jgi:hypothetical protein